MNRRIAVEQFLRMERLCNELAVHPGIGSFVHLLKSVAEQTEN